MVALRLDSKSIVGPPWKISGPLMLSTLATGLPTQVGIHTHTTYV